MKTTRALMTQSMTMLSTLVLLVTTPTLVFSKSEDVVATTPNGSINWTTGIATARGIGIPPKNPASPLQAKEMTRKAAWAVALTNLLEVVKGVHVDSSTTVSNYVATNEEVRTRVEGFIKGARLVKEDPLPDGAYETTVEMKLAGEFSKLVVPKMDPKNRPLDQYQSKHSDAKKHNYAPKAHTGLVVNAQGLSARPALAPRLLNKDGEEVYSIAYIDRQAAPKDGIVLYAPDPETAKSNPLVTNAPLTIKAVRAEGADLYISDADAQMLHGVPKYFQLLKQAKVAVVLDKNSY